MLNGHLVEEVGRDQEAMAMIKLLADQPDFLGLMRSLVDGTYPVFEAKCHTLVTLSRDAFLRGFMAQIVEEAARAAAAPMPGRKPNGLLRAVAAELVEYGTERTFTTRDIVRSLEARGHPFFSRLPRQSVYFALRALEKAGRVEIVIRGHGRLMNMYRAVEGPQSVLYAEEAIHAG